MSTLKSYGPILDLDDEEKIFLCALVLHYIQTCPDDIHMKKNTLCDCRQRMKIRQKLIASLSDHLKKPTF
jgi:hypothetical protein